MSRLRANQITNENANGAPNFPHGLTVTGIVTATTTSQTLPQIIVGSAVTANSQGIDVTGIVTATTVKVGSAISATDGAISATRYFGDGSGLTGIDATQIATGNTKVQTVASRIDNKIDNVGVLTVTSAGANVSGILTTSYHKVNSVDLIAAVNYRGLNNSSTSNMHNAAEDLKFQTAQAGLANSNVYNTSNGRYTAPVRGIYLVQLRGLFDNSFTSGTASAQIYINGSTTNVFMLYSEATNGYAYGGGSAVIAMNANDYFTIYGETKLHVSSETNFSACLLQAY